MIAAPEPRRADIITRSSRRTRLESGRERVVSDEACAASRLGTRTAASGATAAQERRLRVARALSFMVDSLRRYEPDQVLRDSLSLRPSWAGTPVSVKT